jgi:hypothetical protein
MKQYLRYDLQSIWGLIFNLSTFDNVKKKRKKNFFRLKRKLKKKF